MEKIINAETNKQTTIKKSKKVNTARLVVTAMLAALAAALMFIELPMPFIAPEFYKLDFSEIPVLIGSFTLGPVAGIVIELIKILVKFIIKGTQTGGVGELANFLIGCSFVVPAALFYKFKKNRVGAVLGMLTGTAVMALFGAALNAFLLLPAYAAAFRTNTQAFIDMGAAINPAIDSLFEFCMLAVAPFNLVKGVLVSIITFLIYKPLSRIIHNKI